MSNAKKEKYLEIVARYERAFWRVCLTYEARKDLQQELFHEILLSVWQSVEGFREESNFNTYVYRVAHNTAIRHVEKQSREPEYETFDEDTLVEISDPQSLSQQQQLKRNLAHSIRRLPLMQRQLITMSLDGLSYTEIAEITGLSETNVGVTLTRVRKLIISYMR